MLEEMLTFRPMQVADGAIVADMIKSLYRTLNAPEGYLTDQKIDATFKQLYAQPPMVEIEVFEIDKTIIGYALLFRFWYNEYGGVVLNIDEIFVKTEYRGQGIATYYLSTFLGNRKGDHIALSLEVLPENKGACALYRRLGFKEKETITLHKLLK